jgi:hypothetical protein
MEEVLLEIRTMEGQFLKNIRADINHTLRELELKL